MRIFFFLILSGIGAYAYAHGGAAHAREEASPTTPGGSKRGTQSVAGSMQAATNQQPICVRNAQGVMHCVYLPGARRD